jgi:hypothetical protein
MRVMRPIYLIPFIRHVILDAQPLTGAQFQCACWQIGRMRLFGRLRRFLDDIPMRLRQAYEAQSVAASEAGGGTSLGGVRGSVSGALALARARSVAGGGAIQLAAMAGRWGCAGAVRVFLHDSSVHMVT